jgi:hypothetical protein
VRRDDGYDTRSRTHKGEDAVTSRRAAQVALETEQVGERHRDYKVARVNFARSHDAHPAIAGAGTAQAYHVASSA